MTTNRPFPLKPLECSLFWIALAAALAFQAPRSTAAAPPFDCFVVSDLVRVFEDGYATPREAGQTIRMFGLRNEIVSAQLVVRAHQDLKDLTVVGGSLQQADGATRIAGEYLRWNFVGSIFLSTNTPRWQKRGLIRPAPAWFPDRLDEERQCSVSSGSLKAIYLTLKIPADASAGEYRTDITITANDRRATMPLSLRVYPLALPNERHLKVTEWFSTDRFRKHHAVASSEDERFYRMLKVYAENMAAHRQNVFRVSLDLIDCTRAADGQLGFDFSRFDRWAQVFWKTGQMDWLETGFVARFSEGGWSSSEIVLRAFPVKDVTSGQRTAMAGEQFLPQFLPAFVQHLREKGWLAKTLFHICDEPSNNNVMAWRQASEFVHQHAPELRRIDAIETPHCLGALEVWVPKLDHLATWEQSYAAAQRQGNELWFYTVGIFQGGLFPNKTVDVPLIESRVLHWLNYRFGLTGYLHWGFNAWTDDPIKAPGQHRGDGWHVYPTRDGLLDSLRWEQMRNGLQDYECLWLLENETARIKATLNDRVAALIEPSRRGIEIASRVVASYHEYTVDPAVLYDAKRQAIEETLALEQTPRVLLQTTPMEYSPVANNCAIDVYGWAEPGTEIRINGQAAPVASDGLFLKQISPSSTGQISLTARRGAAAKTLVRKFTLLYSSGPDRSSEKAP